MIRYLGRHYVHYINKTNRRSGTLWERRFRASLVQSEAYLLTLYRYIELNPVRAGMVVQAERYRWSSAHDHLGCNRDSLIVDHELFMRLGVTAEERRIAYRALIRQPLVEAVLAEIRAAVQGGEVLGSEPFKDQIEAQLKRRVTLGSPGRKPKQPETQGADQLGLDI